MKAYIKKTADGISVWFNFQDEFYTLPDYYDDQNLYMENRINEFLSANFGLLNDYRYYFDINDFRWLLSDNYEFPGEFYGIVINL